MDSTSLALNGRIGVYVQLQLALLYWYSLQTALSTFQVIYCTAKGAWQTRHQLRIFLSVFLQGKPQLMTTGNDFFLLGWDYSFSSDPPRRAAVWLSSPTPFPSCMSLSQCAAALCWVFQAFPLFQGGKCWTRWGDSAGKAWFSLAFLCISQLLFLYVIKSLQEARLCNACELHNNSSLSSGCLPNRFIFLSFLQYPSSAPFSFNTKKSGSRKNWPQSMQNSWDKWIICFPCLQGPRQEIFSYSVDGWGQTWGKTS